jgi:hypothetical protein
VEEDPEREAVDVHVVNNWCLLGSARSEDEVAELLQGHSRPRFDLDHYKILARHLSRGRPKVVELGAASFAVVAAAADRGAAVRRARGGARGRRRASRVAAVRTSAGFAGDLVWHRLRN